jgi:hypothetical protein
VPCESEGRHKAVLCWCGVGAPRMGLSTAGRRREAPVSFLALARAQLGLRNMSHDYNNNCCLTLDLLLTRQIISRNEHCDHVLSAEDRRDVYLCDNELLG